MATWERVVKLQEFIKHYIPKGFKEAIHIYSFTPSISEEDYIAFESAYNKAELSETLKNYRDPFLEKFGYGDIDRFNRRDVIEAIGEYFKQAHATTSPSLKRGEG